MSAGKLPSNTIMSVLAILFMVCTVAVAAKDPNLFEGDIVLDDETRTIMKGDAGNAFDGLLDTRRHWPNGIVPYVFSSGFDSKRIAVTKTAFEDYKQRTCIRFKPRTVERNYIRFIIGGGCYSYIGITGGVQDVSIGNGCQYKATVIHELMHAIGFYHEQSRRDRDAYLDIYWNNIPAALKYNFEKYSHGEADYYGESYDLDSVMQYERTAFGNGKVTMAAKGDYYRQLGQNKGFTDTDVQQINKMYRCSVVQPGTVAPTTSAPITSRPAGTCTDTDKDCSYFQGKGYCSAGSYVAWMRDNCKKSCGYCQNTCKDEDKDCSYYQRKGYCYHSYVGWMKVNCKRSCNIC